MLYLRRTVQLVFLALFVAAVLTPRWTSGEHLRPAVHAFFHFDPLLLVATWLTSHPVEAGMWAALATLGLTVVLGRVFCGWVCPLGTLNAIAGRVLFAIWPDRRRRDHWSPWQRTKYFLLVGFLAMAALGGHWVCVWDPLVLLYRSMTAGLLPATQWAVEESSTSLAQSDNPVAKAVARYATEPAYQFLRDNAYGGVDHVGHAYLGGGLILALLAAMLLANRYRPRFWCRYLCPLGALLGVFAWRPWLRRATRESCNRCDLCARDCHGPTSRAPGDQWIAAECLGCFHCTSDCRRSGLGFTWTWPWRRRPAEGSLDLSKRAMLGSAVGGVAALALLRINPQARGKTINPELIRPPGAGPEREFLKRCTACGACMQACPTHGLQPALAEAGLEGIWTPRLVPQIGPCEYGCNACGQVCPTEAIAPLSLEEKQQVRIGLATFDVTRCIPYNFGRECMVCEECCPIPDKAIYYVEVEVQVRDGQRRTIRQPRIDPGRCTGCGRCENVCPIKDRPGVRVTSANETRNPANQPILSMDGDSPY